MASAFHEILFPVDVSLRSRGGVQRRTDIVVTGSGREERNQRWAHARRRYEAGYGIHGFDALHDVLAFFEERRGRLYGFRWRDRLDDRSCRPGAEPSATDQAIGKGDGVTAGFSLTKTYGGVYAPYARPIAKPVAGSVRVAVGGIEAAVNDFVVDTTSGLVTFAPGRIPAAGAAVTAGFRFDVPVRFDADEIMVDFDAFAAGEIPAIPLVEILP